MSVFETSFQLSQTEELSLPTESEHFIPDLKRSEPKAGFKSVGGEKLRP